MDHYDLHYIPYEMALKDKLIWKSNLLGGGRLYHLISRFSNLRKFKDYLNEKEKNDGWVVGEGFIIGNENKIKKLKQYTARRNTLSLKEVEELKKLEKDYKKADYLTGKKTLPTQAFTEKGINEDHIHTLEKKYFIRRRKEEIFRGPHILIKEGVNLNSIPITLRNDDLSFGDKIIGIHAPGNHLDELKCITERIKGNRTYLFSAAAFSGQYMISRATAILKKDIDCLPYPQSEKELELSDIEKILVDDVLEYMLDFRRKGENSKVLKPVNKLQLLQFADIYCSILNSVYKEFKPYEPIESESFLCFPFYYGKEPYFLDGDIDKFERNLRLLVHKKVGENLRITRVLRIYDENIIYLVKPKQVRYWLRSVAVRDADETFADLVKQGY